jgi:hypothetical protein
VGFGSQLEHLILRLPTKPKRAESVSFSGSIISVLILSSRKIWFLVFVCVLETELVGIFLYVIFTAFWVLFLICLVLSLPVVFAASWIVPVLEIFVFCCTANFSLPALRFARSSIPLARYFLPILHACQLPALVCISRRFRLQLAVLARDSLCLLAASSYGASARLIFMFGLAAW